jgi:hypothetical protein
MKTMHISAQHISALPYESYLRKGEHPEPDGMNWTIRKPLSNEKSASNLQLRFTYNFFAQAASPASTLSTTTLSHVAPHARILTSRMKGSLAILKLSRQ